MASPQEWVYEAELQEHSGTATQVQGTEVCCSHCCSMHLDVQEEVMFDAEGSPFLQQQATRLLRAKQDRASVLLWTDHGSDNSQ